MAGAPGEANEFQQLGYSLSANVRCRVLEAQRHLDVLGGAQDRDEAERLEDKADPFPPHAHELLFSHG